MSDEPDMATPEISIPWRMNSLINEMDDLNALARAPETCGFFEAPAVDQLFLRCELMRAAIKTRNQRLRAVS